MSRSPVTSAVQKRSFLDAYGQCGTLIGAAKLSGVDERYHHTWMAKSEHYRHEFALAKDRAAEVLEMEARRRACEGYEEPIYFQGVQVGHVQRYSDLLMMFLLKGAKPDVFRDYHSVKVSGGTTNQSTVTVIHEFRDHRGQVIDTHPITPTLPASTDDPDPS